MTSGHSVGHRPDYNYLKLVCQAAESVVFRKDVPYESFTGRPRPARLCGLTKAATKASDGTAGRPILVREQLICLTLFSCTVSVVKANRFCPDPADVADLREDQPKSLPPSGFRGGIHIRLTSSDR